MSNKKKKTKKFSVTLKPRSALDFLVQEKMADGFILRNTMDLKELSKEVAAHQFVLDGYKSAEPSALALTVVINSVLAHGRIYFVLAKEDFTRMTKYDEGLRKNCSRRKRESVIKNVPYAQFRALMYKSGYFKHVGDVITKNGNEVRILEVIEPVLRSHLVASGAIEESQVKEIHDFYERSRKQETDRVEAENRSAERKAALKKAEEERNEQRRKDREASSRPSV